MRNQGFTIVELLVVIGILAILATVVVIIINPWELTKQARDATRVSDLGTINKSLGMYQTGGGTSLGSSSVVYVSIPSPNSDCSDLGLPNLPSGWSYACVSSSTLAKINGTGWIPVDLTSLSYGSPIEKLPIDPINTTSTGNYYTYVGGGFWESNTILESEKYQDKVLNDGGDASLLYEAGNNLALVPTEINNRSGSGTSQDTTPPIAGAVTSADTSYGSYVDSPFNLSAIFTDNESAVSSCEYTANGGTNWYAATVSGNVPNYTCSKIGLTGTDGTSLSLNMRATSSGGMATATPISRTVDGLTPNLGGNNFSDGFEDGALDPFTTDGSANWGTTTATVNTGIYSVKAGTITHNASTSMYLTQTIGTGGRTLSFARSVSSESGYDFLKFYIDGVQVQPTSGSQWSGNVSWGNVNFSVPAGSHTFKWTYLKDGSVSSGSDTAWVDDIVIADTGVLTAVPSDSQASLSWTAATDSGSGLNPTSAYKVVFSTGSSPAANCANGTQIYSGADTSYNHAGLTNGLTYYYRVCAYDAVSNVSTGVTTQAIPAIPLPGRYWVGNSGNWSDTAHWSATSGGAGGASAPTSNDDVYFNAYSFTAASQTVTINVSAATKNMDWTGVTNTPTLAGSSALNIAGSLTLASGMTRTYTGAITFSATSTGQTITLAGKTLGGDVTFNGSGGGWTLQDAFNIGTSKILIIMRGSLNTNNQTVTCGIFNSIGSDTRALTLGSSLINVSLAGTPWDFSNITGLTFNAGTSQITINGGLRGGGLTYNNVILNGAGTATVSGANTFNNLTRSGTATATNQLSLGDDQTITGTLTLSGNSAVNRLWVLTDINGTARTLTAAAVSLTNVDFRDITGAGTATPFSGTSIGNALGNSSINFTAAVARYWVGNGGNWNSTSKWSASSGGASGASVPLPQDTVIFDASSITSTGQTITANMPRLGADINFSAVANNPTLSFGSTPNTIFGSLTLGSNMIISGAQRLTFSSRSAVNLTNNGKQFLNAITIDAPGGALVMQDDFNSTSSLTLTQGTLTANNKNITADFFSSFNSNVRAINMGSGTWTLTGPGNAWEASYSGLTLNADTSSIVINNNSATAKNFMGGGTFYNLRFTNTGTSIFTIMGSNIFNNLTIDTAPKFVNFTANTTQTVNGVFTANGFAGNSITLRSSASPTKWAIAASATSFSYIDVKDSTGSGTASPFVCGATCVDSGNNTGWSF